MPSWRATVDALGLPLKALGVLGLATWTVLEVSLPFSGLPAYHGLPRWKSCMQSESGLMGLGEWLQRDRGEGVSIASSVEFFHRIQYWWPGETAAPGDGNPFPGLLPANHSYGRTFECPRGVDPDQMPLMWDTQTNPFGEWVILFWNGRMRVVQLGDRANTPPALARCVVHRAGSPPPVIAFEECTVFWPKWWQSPSVRGVRRAVLPLLTFTAVYLFFVRPAREARRRHRAFLQRMRETG
jgi:hypothetical protein